MRYEEIIVTLEGSGYLFLLFAWRTRAMTAAMSMPFPCNIHTCHPLSFTIGGKEASPPKKSRETAYRGTGSTTDSVAQISTDCKKRAGHIAQQCGDMPRPVFTGMSADLTGQRMSYTDLMVRFCSSSSTLREVCTVTR